jgi:hypothetical protein
VYLSPSSLSCCKTEGDRKERKLERKKNRKNKRNKKRRSNLSNCQKPRGKTGKTRPEEEKRRCAEMKEGNYKIVLGRERRKDCKGRTGIPAKKN